jgi:hypothetical protein
MNLTRLCPQEEVINSVKGIGKQLGILKDDDEDEDY